MSRLRLEIQVDGLSGLAWEDQGILLEFEGGAWYRRLGSDPAIDRLDLPSWNGTVATVGPSDDGSADICVEAECFSVLRTSELGGVQLIGVDIDGAIHLLVTDVRIGDTVEVTETIRTYEQGQLVASSSFEVSDQFVDVPHAYEVTSSGQILHLRTETDRVLVEVVNTAPGGESGTRPLAGRRCLPHLHVAIELDSGYQATGRAGGAALPSGRARCSRSQGGYDSKP